MVKPVITIEPVVSPAPVPRTTPHLRDGQDLFRIAFRMRPSWMAEGESVELRFPEVLRSSAGLHVLDHYLSSLTPRSDPAPLPTWTQDSSTGEWGYHCTLPDGVAFEARVLAHRETVDLTFLVTNGTAEPLHNVEPTMCLDLKGAPAFGDRFRPDDVFASFQGELKPLSFTTPRIADMNRRPWLLILTESGVATFGGPADSPTWWRTDQIADRALMASRSSDARHLIGYAWEGAPETLMSNGGNPCLHAGPAAARQIAPGATAAFHGKVYFLDDPDLAGLAERYDADLPGLSPSPRARDPIRS